MIATKRAAPMMDHRIGNGCRSMVTINGSGSLSNRATQGPRRAPTKPRAIETISPPRTLPAMAFPMAPQTAAITRRSRSPVNDIVMVSSFRASGLQKCQQVGVELFLVGVREAMRCAGVDLQGRVLDQLR